jgi:hypothetical protein
MRVCIDPLSTSNKVSWSYFQEFLLDSLVSVEEFQFNLFENEIQRKRIGEG